MQMDDLRDLYIGELKDLYNAEKQLLKALPKMAKHAANAELKAAFTEHLTQTEAHVSRLERIFDTMEASPRGKTCKGMEGLIDEAQELIDEDAQEDVLDAGLIAKAQRVEHYEISGYGTVRTYALTLGEADHAALLQETLNEEEKTDKLLTALAERSINVDAAIGDEDSQKTESRSATGDREVKRTATSDRGSKVTRGPGRKRAARDADETRTR